MRFRRGGARKPRAGFKPRSKAAKRSAISHSLTTLQKKEVKILVKKPAELKYAVSDRYGVKSWDIVYGSIVVGPPVALCQNLYAAMPDIIRGVDSNQRIGNKISSVHGKTHFSFCFDPLYGAALSTNDWYVRIFMLKSRQVKFSPSFNALQSNTLLDLGSSQTLDWRPNGQTTGGGPASYNILAMMPISKENFTGHYKTFRMSKNQGLVNRDATGGQTTNLSAHNVVNFTWNWSHAGNVLYDDNQAQPSNFAPFFTYVAYPVDTYGGANIDTTGILATVRTEVYYKDV